VENPEIEHCPLHIYELCWWEHLQYVILRLKIGFNWYKLSINCNCPLLKMFDFNYNITNTFDSDCLVLYRKLWFTDIDKDTEHDTDIHLSTLVIIWENQYNWMCQCRIIDMCQTLDTPVKSPNISNLQSDVSMLHWMIESKYLKKKRYK
jgi:hypothetical protein